MAVAAAAAEEEETHPLLGAEPAIGSCKTRDVTAEEGKAIARMVRCAAAMETASRRRARGCFPFPFGKKLVSSTIPVDQPLDAQQLQMHREERDRRHRSMLPGRCERLAKERKFVLECLRHYNSMHPDDEYEPAPGKLTQYHKRDNHVVWTHGNFVARRKRSGCFSILPAPRTIFFFELIASEGFEGIVTCTPLDEPVTEAYSIMGFPLWWSTRRSGRFDCQCKTCYRHFDLPHPFIRKTFACGHDKVERVCEMCYFRSHVLHPFPGEFTYGYREYKYRHRCY
ncbi:uncharacterized protein LOC127765942 [Oryza glaberrima]|uniref:DUF3615 domain-containing protein n=2 Tax=Oryza TaxID=4527 RepID=A0A0D3FCP5_9ORYZ|nr:uncharacterized protein LOC127765942 [Oryza glaberrima]